MKFAFLTLLSMLAALAGFSQSMPPIDSVRLVTPADYRAAEPIALRVCNYILSTPSDDKSLPRLNGTRFLLDWMGGTPDYTFDLDKKVIKYFEKDIDLMGVYTAALASLAVKKFIAYIGNANNKVAVDSKLQEMIAADQKGQFN